MQHIATDIESPHRHHERHKMLLNCSLLLYFFASKFHRLTPLPRPDHYHWLLSRLIFAEQNYYVEFRDFIRCNYRAGRLPDHLLASLHFMPLRAPLARHLFNN